MPDRRLSYLDEAKADIRRIFEEDRQLGELILQRLSDLRLGRLDGIALEARAAGDLSDCRKVYVGVRGGDPTHRIVYRLIGGTIEVIEVVVVGRRDAAAVYLEALRRLGRD